ncbi:MULTISPECIES: hypothetical protein [unclassified Oscillibacter]|nr:MULTISPECIES: hypothetical protein [unclassified Oscillibacter]
MHLPDVFFSRGSYALSGNSKPVLDIAADRLIGLNRRDGKEP